MADLLERRWQLSIIYAALTGALRFNEFAEAVAGISPRMLSERLRDLEAAGLVSGAPDPTDGRQTILSLTTACREWIKASRAAREDWLFRAIRTTLTAGEQEQLAVTVELLNRLVDS